MDMSKYIGEATAYDKKLMLERKEPLSWLKSISAEHQCVRQYLWWRIVVWRG